MPPNPLNLNVEGPTQLLRSGLNKTPYEEPLKEGVDGDLQDEFSIDLSDEELLALASDTEKAYGPYWGGVKRRAQAQKEYYLGKVDADAVTPISSNLIFEAEETFLPAALSKNPEPVVFSDNTEEGNKQSNDVKTMLQYHADVLVLRRKLTRVTRNWSTEFIGVMKHGWDNEIGDIMSDVRKPENFIFDPDAQIDEYGDCTGIVGERISIKASKLIDKFPKFKEYITIMVSGKLGTSVVYTEWWNDDYCFYTYVDKVLDKHKNPHFNYDKKEVQQDEFGMSQEVEIKGNNHFARPKKPYTFLTVFNFGDHPHDSTGLIEQNIPNQNRITRRTNQIDYNLSRANNSDVFSENNFNQESAKQASVALAAGRPILVPPGGPIGDAIHRLQAPGIDAGFFTALETDKQDLRTIFGTQGITATSPDEDETARGMILNNEHDNSRIGGGIGDALEQFADNVFNWWVQLYYVYYDEPHYAMIMGQMKAVEYVELSSQNLTARMVVSVSPDSLKPHDEITEMNQAMALYDKGALDPKTLLTLLNVPDPQKTAEMAVLWIVDKNAYLQLNFPELAQQLAGIQQQQMQQAQAMGGQAAEAAGSPTEVPGSPPQNMSVAPAGAELSQVPIQ